MTLPIAQITELERQKSFIFGGSAYFTIVNPATGNRFTYHISESKKEEGLFWVCVLTGPENTSDYTFIGRITKEKEFKHSPKSIGKDAKSVQAFMWWYHHIMAGNMPQQIDFYHCGRCCVCGKLLTTPESILAGIGPVCAGR